MSTGGRVALALGAMLTGIVGGSLALPYVAFLPGVWLLTLGAPAFTMLALVATVVRAGVQNRRRLDQGSNQRGA